MAASVYNRELIMTNHLGQDLVGAYEERLNRQRQEAYRDDLRSRAVEMAKERRVAVAAQPETWADRSQARHADRFHARYMKYMQRKLGGPQQDSAEAELPTTSSQVDVAPTGGAEHETSC